MPLRPIRFLYHKDISNLNLRLMEKIPNDASDEEIIEFISKQLIVSTDGDTYLLDDLLNCPIEERSLETSPKFCLEFDNEFDKVFPTIEQYKDDLVKNKKLAEILYHLGCEKNYVFELPKSPITGIPMLEPYIADANDIDALDLSNKAAAIPNKALTELLQLRYQHSYRHGYDKDRLKEDLKQQKQVIKNQVTELEAKIAANDERIQLLETSLSNANDFVGKSEEQLEQLKCTFDKQHSKYSSFSKFLPTAIQYATFALGLIPIAAFIALFILNPPVTTTGLIIGLSLGAATTAAGLATSMFSAVTTTLYSKFKIEDKIKAVNSNYDRLNDFKYQTAELNRLRKEQSTLTQKLIASNERLNLLQRLKGRFVEIYHIANSKLRLHQSIEPIEAKQELQEGKYLVAAPRLD